METRFPAIHSIFDPGALANHLETCYDLGSVARVEFYSGGFNDTYRARMQDGSTTWLRAYRLRWRTAADIHYELDVLNHLKQKNFPSVRPIQRRDGAFTQPIPAPEGERYLALFEEAKGRELNYDSDLPQRAQRYGQMVAEMHNALDDFSSPHKRFHKDLNHFLDQPLRNVEPYLSHRKEQWSYFQQFVEKIRARILALPAAALEQGVCHGDLQGYHVNVDGDGNWTFFDFDCCGYGYRAYDLAVFLWVTRLQADEIKEERWTHYLRGYQERRALNPLDLAAVPLFTACRYLWHMSVHTQNAYDWGCSFLNDAYFDNRLKQLKQLEIDYHW
ncbi:MAG: phosphotransferase [Anaerolineaceae bacterium]|nr:phosphotransferase [Anaerolineaceae bacterium]